MASKEDISFSKIKAKNAEELLVLKDEMRGLVDVMILNQRDLTFEESQEIANIEFRLEFALKNLVEETRIKEAKFKLKAMRDLLAVVKCEVKL